MIGPVAAGLMGTVLPALGHFPAIGLTGPNLEPITALFHWPGLARAAALSISVGLGATIVSLAVVTLLTAAWSGTRFFGVMQRLLSPLLSVPHAAAAFGLAFLIAPSGWISRIASPGVTGWERPPDVLILNDPHGLSLMMGLIVKEIPFLLLMTLAALGQTDTRRSMQVATSLGYQRATAWLKIVFPRVYAQIRLPVYVVLAYSMSVVDIAIILGPNTPSTLSVQIVKWMSHPDLTQRTLAAAAALLQLGLVVLAILLWRIAEGGVSRIGRRWVLSGERARWDSTTRVASATLGSLAALAVILGLIVLSIWSFAGFWGFPDPLPDTLTLRTWSRNWDGIVVSLWETLLIALACTAIAILLTVGCLEAEYRHGFSVSNKGLWVLYLPLIVPQTAFLPGLQTLLLQLRFDGGVITVIIAHLVFVLPYVFLSLSGPYRAWDQRVGTVGLALGAAPPRVFWRLRLPMLLRPLLTAFAIGIAVSVGQYLPTLLLGGGRVATLTTEAVALGSGGDRRAIGAYALMQTLTALLPFVLALTIPALVWRHRQGMRLE